MTSKRMRKHDADFTRLRIEAQMSYKRGAGSNQTYDRLREEVKRELGLFSWDDPDG